MMTKLSLVAGAVLILLGAVGYVGSGGESVTALIPAFFGVPMVILGVLGQKPERVRWTMHVAMGLMLLGLAGSASGIPKVIQWLQGGEVARPFAAQMQAAMALVCIVFLILGIKSFIDARRRQASG